MNTPQETREAAIDRVRRLWSSAPGKYWDELRIARLDTTDIFPEYAVKDFAGLPDLDKDEQTKKGKR